MAKKSIPTEELLRLVKELPPIKRTAAQSEIFDFCTSIGLKSDIYEIPKNLIYNLYLNWIKQFEAKEPMDIRAFFRKFKESFENKSTVYNSFYYCNLEPFNLTVEQHSKLYRDLRNVENQKAKESRKRTKEKKLQKATERQLKKEITQEIADQVIQKLEEKKATS